MSRVYLKNGHGTVPVTACTSTGSGYTYRKKGGCPGCESDLEIFIREGRDHPDYDWVGFAERCVNYDDGCDHRIP